MRNISITVSTMLLFITAAFTQSDKKQTQITLSLDSFLAKLATQANPQIIDARSPEEFALNHIGNALNFNLQTIGYAAQEDRLDKSRPVFIYAINTGRSTALANDLKSKGFAEAYDLAGGIANWIGSGNPYCTSVKKGLSLVEYKKIITSNETVLVDIGSRYCPLCKKVKPVLDSMRKENGDAVKIVEIDLEESPELIAQLKTVNAFPYLVVYRKGIVALKRSGINDLKTALDQALAKVK